MAILPILKWPDPRLSQVCDPVGVVTEDLRALARDMLETMYDAPGRGLAGPQVGVLRRVFVMDATWKDGAPDPVICFDPFILEASDEVVTREEACLSIPDLPMQVSRPARILLQWTSPEGARVVQSLDGFAAGCAQHEIDHLDGRVILDHQTPATRAALEAAHGG